MSCRRQLSTRFECGLSSNSRSCQSPTLHFPLSADSFYGRLHFRHLISDTNCQKCITIFDSSSVTNLIPAVLKNKWGENKKEKEDTSITTEEEAHIPFVHAHPRVRHRRTMLTLTHLLKLAVAALLATHARFTTAEHWAVIVAGSRGYENYRHQADACHAYHVVRRHGIPEENVVLMMYDDVASHKANPFPGQLFNKPTAGNGSDELAVDVYEGCKVDYKGKDVTPNMFINVLLGNSTATNGRKVLGSTDQDRVFVNFVDHGARGFIVFPNGQELSSKRLARALKQMHGAKKYKELVFYMEGMDTGCRLCR